MRACRATCSLMCAKGAVRPVSELCQIPSETARKHSALPGHSDKHRCCGKSLTESALVHFGVGQHSRPEPISKRA